jgi:hypothetical protein
MMMMIRFGLSCYLTLLYAPLPTHLPTYLALPTYLPYLAYLPPYLALPFMVAARPFDNDAMMMMMPTTDRSGQVRSDQVRSCNVDV